MTPQLLCELRHGWVDLQLSLVPLLLVSPVALVLAVAEAKGVAAEVEVAAELLEEVTVEALSFG